MFNERQIRKIVTEAHNERRAMGLTRERIAGFLGITVNDLKRIEARIDIPSQDVAHKLKDYFSVSIW